MKKNIIVWSIILTALSVFISCDEDFLVRAPLDTPSLETFWQSANEAEMWVNNLYNGLEGAEGAVIEAFSDNAWGRAALASNFIANGTFETNNSHVNGAWDYSYIRLALEFFENIDRVPNISQTRLDLLTGQVHFHLAYQYFRLITLFRDVPLVTRPLDLNESDVPKNPKEEVLQYILEQIDLAIAKLPIEWETSETGRVTRGAALALKARVLLYNERWQEAADIAKEVIDSNLYELHPNFGEVFMESFNNQTKEVILAYQNKGRVLPGAESILYMYAPVALGCCAIVLPTPQLEASFEMKDGLPIDESPLYNPSNPFENRDPRYYDTFLYHGDILGDAGQFSGQLDLSGRELNFARTYLYFKKYLEGRVTDARWGEMNWIKFRYAEILLIYAEAKNEASGPDNSVYEALDQIRMRAGMPPVDRNRYSDQASLRKFIRNERRVELAGEGLRYFDIIRWRIAEETLNINLSSMDLKDWVNGPLDVNGNPILIERAVETRTFNPNRHYVWPIPQDAIDRSDNILVQHPEW